MPPPSPDSTTTRLRLLRKVHGYETGAAFAAFLGISVQRWNNVEIGHPLGKDLAFTLVKKIPGLSLDWLFYGNPAALPVELAKRLGEFGGADRKGTTAPPRSAR